MAEQRSNYATPFPVRLSRELRERLRATALREGMPQSAILRRGLVSELDRLDTRH